MLNVFQQTMQNMNVRVILASMATASSVCQKSIAWINRNYVMNKDVAFTHQLDINAFVIPVSLNWFNVFSMQLIQCLWLFRLHWKRHLLHWTIPSRACIFVTEPRCCHSEVPTRWKSRQPNSYVRRKLTIETICFWIWDKLSHILRNSRWQSVLIKIVQLVVCIGVT